MIPAELNYRNLKHWSKPAGHSAAMSVFLNCISVMFIFMLKCNNLASGQLISHEAVVHHFSPGAALQGSNGICCGNQSEQR